jgi:acetylornithine deacetylase
VSFVSLTKSAQGGFMKEIESMISNYIDQNKDELLSMIQQAIRIQSTTGYEQPMQSFMKERYKEIGLEVTSFEPDYKKLIKHEAFCDSGIPFAGRGNVIGVYKGKGTGLSLTLHGHVDVVPPTPLEKWTKDPWGAEIEGNRLYGRGSADMKAGLLVNWFALKTLLDLGIYPEGTVQLHSVIEEEAGGGGGALACMEEGYLTDGFITTEPHNLNITVAHAGILYFRVRVLGKTAHAGLAHLGVNAISKMFKIYNALEELDYQRAKEVYYDLFHKGSGQSVHLNRGKMIAGDWVSTVAGEATLECRIGFVPSESRADIKKLIEETVALACKGDLWLTENPPKIEWFGWTTEAWYQDPQDPYVISFKQTAERVLGREVEIIGRASGNDARFTQYYDRAGIGFGPRGANLHGPDEYVEIDSIIVTAKILANHIVNWTTKK